VVQEKRDGWCVFVSTAGILYTYICTLSGVGVDHGQGRVGARVTASSATWCLRFHVRRGVLATVAGNLALLVSRPVLLAKRGDLRVFCLAAGFSHRFFGFSDFRRFQVRRGVLATVFGNLALLGSRPVFLTALGDLRRFRRAAGFGHRYFGFSDFRRFHVRRGVLATVAGIFGLCASPPVFHAGGGNLRLFAVRPVFRTAFSAFRLAVRRAGGTGPALRGVGPGRVRPGVSDARLVNGADPFSRAKWGRVDAPAATASRIIPCPRPEFARRRGAPGASPPEEACKWYDRYHQHCGQRVSGA